MSGKWNWPFGSKRAKSTGARHHPAASRPRRRSPYLGILELERRTLLSVTASLNSGVLDVDLSAANDQARGGPIDCRSDLFSLGSVLSRCVPASRPSAPPRDWPCSNRSVRKCRGRSGRSTRSCRRGWATCCRDCTPRTRPNRIATAQDVADLLALHFAELTAARHPFAPQLPQGSGSAGW
jgi:hypothetical protein